MNSVDHTLMNLNYVVHATESNRGYIMGPRTRSTGAKWVAAIQHNGEFTAPQQEALGHLYAAAPKLLAMLQTLITGLEWNIENHPTVMNQSDDEALVNSLAGVT